MIKGPVENPKPTYRSCIKLHGQVLESNGLKILPTLRYRAGLPFRHGKVLMIVESFAAI